jgi:hypothetical protein
MQLYSQRRFQDALTPAGRALGLARQHLGPSDPETARMLNNLGELHCEMGNPALAVPLLRQAIEVWRVALGEAHRSVYSARMNLAAAHRALGDAKAAEFTRTADKGRDRGVAPDDDGPDARRAREQAKAEPLLRQIVERAAGSSARTIPTSPPASTTSLASTRRRAGQRRPNRSCDEHSRSAGRPASRSP